MPFADALLRALSFSFGMAWEIAWALILGFFLSAVVSMKLSQSYGLIKRAQSPTNLPESGS